MKNIIENNRLIAEFLKWSNEIKNVSSSIYEDNKVTRQKLYTSKFGKYLSKDLKFHSDWNWLMEVVDKIESLEEVDDFRIEISQVRIVASTSNNDFYGKVEYSNRGRFTDAEGGLITKIEATYSACVEFIKWYNNND